MKKSVKITTAAALALSALTPVAAFAAETESPVESGIYYSGGFLTAAQFKALTSAEKKAVLTDKLATIVMGDVVQKLLPAVTDKNAPTYTVAQYEEEFSVNFDSSKGFEGQTPEENLIETFFYNLAA